jgi:Ser/Thr protein kinase RdoA (MazF antagonist)
VAVLKVSNPAEDPEVLDMEAAAALHVHHIDPALRVARPWPVPGAPDAFRARWNDGEDVYWVRAYDVIPGTGRVDPTTLDDRALRSWGSTSARLGRALRGFTHPRAHRTMLWDVQHAARSRDLLVHIPDDARRAAVERVLDRFEEVFSLRGRDCARRSCTVTSRWTTRSPPPTARSPGSWTSGT